MCVVGNKSTAKWQELGGKDVVGRPLAGSWDGGILEGQKYVSKSQAAPYFAMTEVAATARKGISSVPALLDCKS
jgi:hypothetical protein